MPTSSSSGVSRPKVLGPATTVAARPATGMDTASALMPSTSSPTCWVSRMYAAQQRRRGQREGHADRVDRARPRLGQQQHADGGQRRPDLGAALAARHRDAERPEELQRAGRARAAAGPARP